MGPNMKCRRPYRTLRWIILATALILSACDNPITNGDPQDGGNGGGDPAPVSRTISFNPNGGDGSMDSLSAASGASLTLPAATFTRGGYRFIGWSTAEDGEVEYADGAEFAVGATDITLYAMWSTDDYVISYYLNGGTNDPENPTSYTTETPDIVLAAASREGYTFAGWFANAELGGETVTLIEQGSTGDVLLYAAWTANLNTITFDANGGEGSMATQQIATAATAPLLPNQFTRIGHTFTGWSTTEVGEVEYADEAEFTMGTADVTLFAVWAEVIFNPGVGPNGTVTSVAVQADGKIVIAGLFTQVAGVNRGRVARLNPDGTLDTTFNPGTGADAQVRTIALHADGKIVIGGDFSRVNGVDRRGIARLNPDGSLDEAFEADLQSPGGLWVNLIAPYSDGSLVIGGQFTGVGGTARSRMARVGSTGAADPDFDLDPQFWPGNELLATLDDGSLIVGGSLYSQDGLTLENRFARVLSDGVVDRSYSPGPLNESALTGGVQSSGQVVIAGWFTEIGAVPMPHLARLLPAGGLDTGFPDGVSPNTRVLRLMVLPNDSMIIATGGIPNFRFIVNGEERWGIARLDVDGSLDTAFNGGSGPNGTVSAIALTTTGRVLIAGAFTSYNGVSRTRIAVLNDDGSVQQ